MTQQISIPLSQTLYQNFTSIAEQLKAGHPEKLSKALGATVADLSCEILQRLFGDLVAKQASLAQTEEDRSIVRESQKVLDQVSQTFHKYLPYAVSLFGNERLVPLVVYLQQQITAHQGQYFIHYDIDDAAIAQMQQHVAAIQQGDAKAVPLAFAGLIQIIDAGVSSLIREPKKLLKFNVVVNKTLDGVIRMTTHLGYKRLENLGTTIGLQRAQNYVTHFLQFAQPKGQ